MHLRKFSKVKPFIGQDKTEIRQYFQPNDTNKGIRYSLAHFTLGPTKRSAKHKVNSSEVYFILEGKGKIVIDKILLLLNQVMLSISHHRVYNS